MTPEHGRIIAQTRDPHDTDEPERLEYQRRNVQRGRMPGQARIRIRYKCYATPSFDCLLVSWDELREVLQDTGWEVRRLMPPQGVTYTAIIEKGRC